MQPADSNRGGCSRAGVAVCQKLCVSGELKLWLIKMYSTLTDAHEIPHSLSHPVKCMLPLVHKWHVHATGACCCCAAVLDLFQES